MKRQLPARTAEVKECHPRALFVFEKFKEDARIGSAALAWRTANAIVRHARIESVPITHAMNVLLYAGELR
jgi:hypothetical protein